MSTEIKEQLSALMDGEAQSEATRFVLRSVRSDATLAASWSRYHIARACLKKQPVLLVDAGFAAAVMARIDAGDAAPQRGGRWMRYLSGGAVAAAVAVVALMASAPRQEGATPGHLVAGASTVASPATPRLVPFNDSALQPMPQLAQPASATVGGDTFFAPGYDLRSQPSNGWRPADPSLAVRHGNPPYVLLIVPAQPAPGEKVVQPRLQ